MTVLRAKAPAKINLSLDILDKRPDGYHNLRSVMASVSLYDNLTLTLKPRQAGLVTARAQGVAGNNIAAKAARLFMDAAGIKGWSVHIDIHKRIPIAAGLGGGSSDAAAVLRVLDGWLASLWTAKADGQRPRLQDIALELGSDVPYCLRGGCCLAEGRGEILTPLAPLPECWIVLSTPPIKVPTAEMFAKFNTLDPRDLAEKTDNVFEAVVQVPEVTELKQKLTELGAGKALMSGSGPTVFGIFDDETRAKQAFDQLRAQFPKTFLTMPV